jgi:predicted RNase H-like HicB family nuclease
MNQTVTIVVWEEDAAWLGYLPDYPDYWTQGKSLNDLKEHLEAVYRDITSDDIPGVRKHQ